MPKTRKPTKQQLAVLDSLFAGDDAEQTVLKNHGVARSIYEKWLAEERFVREFERRIARAYRQSRITLARNAPKAAQRLMKLATAGEGETNRKACLDILSLQHAAGPETLSDAQPVPEPPAPPADLAPETASRLLATLAGRT